MLKGWLRDFLMIKKVKSGKIRLNLECTELLKRLESIDTNSFYKT
jgi:hypothetical protein